MFWRANIKLIIYEIEEIPAISHRNPHVQSPCISPVHQAAVFYRRNTPPLLSRAPLRPNHPHRFFNNPSNTVLHLHTYYFSGMSRMCCISYSPRMTTLDINQTPLSSSSTPSKKRFHAGASVEALTYAKNEKAKKNNTNPVILLPKIRSFPFVITGVSKNFFSFF